MKVKTWLSTALRKTQNVPREAKTVQKTKKSTTERLNLNFRYFKQGFIEAKLWAIYNFGLLNENKDFTKQTKKVLVVVKVGYPKKRIILLQFIADTLTLSQPSSDGWNKKKDRSIVAI